MINTTTISGKAGVYLRLSRDDGDKVESDSIKNQRQLITDFIEKSPRLSFVKEYIDDGYSGTNFNRPSFQNMLSDANNKKIDCIIVKDLSRLGRNYIETGRFLEKIFPVMGIRVIAINDNYDSLDNSSDDNQIIVPFKNLINDAYCRDISMKIRSHFDIKRRNGQFIGNFPVYGYKKDPENKNKIIIDDQAAEVVSLIYKMKLSGMGIAKIADKLDSMGIAPPYDYKRKSGLNYNSGFRSNGKLKWPLESINRILTNEVYTGTMIQGRRRKINYKVKKSLPVKKEDWICVEGTHQPIVSKEEYDMVQRLFKLDTRTATGEECVFPLSGYLKCADCGQNMVRRSSKTKSGKTLYYYHCSTHKSNHSCSSHNISAEKIESALLGAIKNQIVILEKSKSVLEAIENKPKENISVKLIDIQAEKLKKEIVYYGDLKVKLYKDFSNGVLTKDDYNELNKRFQTNQEQAEAILNDLFNKKANLINGNIQIQPWIDTLLSFQDLTELNRTMVVSLVKSIEITKSQDIIIHFLFEDELGDVLNQ